MCYCNLWKLAFCHPKISISVSQYVIFPSGKFALKSFCLPVRKINCSKQIVGQRYEFRFQVLQFLFLDNNMIFVQFLHAWYILFCFQIAEYKGEYHRNHPVINLFWETFYSFNLDKKKMFLGKPSACFVYLIAEVLHFLLDSNLFFYS